MRSYSTVVPSTMFQKLKPVSSPTSFNTGSRERETKRAKEKVEIHIRVAQGTFKRAPLLGLGTRALYLPPQFRTSLPVRSTKIKSRIRKLPKGRQQWKRPKKKKSKSQQGRRSTGPLIISGHSNLNMDPAPHAARNPPV